MATPAERFISLGDELALIVRSTLARHFPGLPPQDREDVEQDVRFKFWSCLASGKNFDQAALYIMRMVFSTAIDSIRRRRRHLTVRAALVKPTRENRGLCGAYKER